MTSLDESVIFYRIFLLPKIMMNCYFLPILAEYTVFHVFEIPEGSRIAKGRAIVNLLPLTPDEHVVKLLVHENLKINILVMVTKNGTN